MADESTTPETEGTESTEDKGTEVTDAATAEDKDGDESGLGDAGKKALSEERAARKAAEARVKELEAEASRLRRSNAATKGTDIEAIKAEIQAEFAAQIVATEIKAEAKGRLNDPADVSRYPEYFEGIKPGDEKAIKAAVDKLLTEKPYLAAADPKKGWGDVGGTGRKAAESEPASAVDRMRRFYSSK
ncbi:hypothetical protein [Streptomyces sp. NRRL S-475]|uniref:hypothetical protein n=1 Tax=Streptomyces sp. NRRL S-475 TaxID=1463910 RepID=UPI00068983B9|nr:hypothetical protein [Streptomyces sp. NRRL S-475]